jgi:imidazolonepropionase-like amidohydrolase
VVVLVHALTTGLLGAGLLTQPVPSGPAALAASVPADTVRYVVMNHGRTAGEMTVARRGDTLEVRYGHIDRNRGRWLFGRYVTDAGGAVVGGAGGPMSRDWVVGEAQEGFGVGAPEREAGAGAGAGPRQNGGAVASDAPFLRRFRTPFEDARLARLLLDRPQPSLTFGDGDQVRAEVVAEVDAATASGDITARFVTLRWGPGTPSGVWIDERGELVATEVGWFITVRPDAVDALPALRAAETEYRDREAEVFARRLAPPPTDALLIRGARLFDSETGRVLPDRSVLIEGERITAVGADHDITRPAGARVIEARGRTLMPGMWDMHSHSGLTSQNAGAPLQLANGLTTVRDLAADLDVAVSLRDRAERGSILSPRQVLAGFIEGPGLWAGPTDVLARTEGEARRVVARYDSLGYRQIKLYNLVHPDLLPAIADEAQRRGMRLSGHVLRGLSIEAAVRLGYDEINHAAFLFSDFFPDSLFLPEMRPYSGVAAAVAPEFDVDGPEMGALIDFLARHDVVMDGTFNIWMGGREILEGEASASARAYGRLLARLHEAGVVLVPGTDNFSGSTYLTELLLYEHAGVPAPEVLRLATLVPAQVMGDDDDYGSITAGKVADLVLVDGNPDEQIADLEHIDLVVRAGRTYEPDAIRAALEEGG